MVVSIQSQQWFLTLSNKNVMELAILMATYNGGRYIREQIDSIINQTYNGWHLYIRDDGSNDNTLAIINEYCQKYENITLKFHFFHNFFQFIYRVIS